MKYILKQELIFEMADLLGDTIRIPDTQVVVSSLGYIKLNFTPPGGIRNSLIITKEQFDESFYPHDMEARQKSLADSAKAAETIYSDSSD